MSYPRLEVSLGKIRHNTRKIIELCSAYGIQAVGVPKVSCGSIEITQAMVDGGVSIIADSRLENLREFKEIKAEKMLLRLPMISRVGEVIEYADMSLNSELRTIKCLSDEAMKRSKIHRIILMIDVGDLREGIFEEDEVINSVESILKYKGVKLIGLGTNLSCFGGIIPNIENLNKLITLKEKIETKFNIPIDIMSGGNSSSFHLIQNGQIPAGINQLRIGTSILLGIVEITNTRIKDTYCDAFKLTVEIIEIKDKPSKPIGEIGIDAFGNKPSFEDIGIRKRAICAVGKQEIDVDWMIPIDSDIKILGGSSDHLILDITNCSQLYEVGGKVSFILNYVAILKAMTSKYVAKYYFD